MKKIILLTGFFILCNVQAQEVTRGQLMNLHYKALKAEQANNMQEALEIYKTILSINADLPTPYLRMADIYAADKNNKESLAAAAALYTKYLTLRPNDENTASVTKKVAKLKQLALDEVDLEKLLGANVLKIENGANDRKPAMLNNSSPASRNELMESIPTGASNPHRYALIIGNEDYSRAGVNAEVNVPYAVNDAMVFREYCLKTFGIPANQIKLIQNATAGIMHEQLDWLINMAYTDPQAELFFFFSGHGNNDERSKDAFLVPVDVSGKNIRFGISIETLYAELAKYPIKGAYVFLDACFSGGFKGKSGLSAAKAVRIAPNTGVPQGNTLCISSSTGDQTSNVYHEKGQGYFTYYLLKTLQDSGGNISLKSLYEKTSAAVKHQTARDGKMQEPQLLVSYSFLDWENIQLVKQ